MNKIAMITTALVLSLSTPAIAEKLTGPAPDGEPMEVARQVIAENFDYKDCPAVTEAVRMLDGSIGAQCSNDEVYRIFTLRENGARMAMSCSAAAQFDLPC